MKNPCSPKNIISIIAVAMITLVTLTNLAQAGGRGTGAATKSRLRERVRADILIPKSNGKTDQVQYSQDDLEQTRSALLELVGAVKDFTGLAPGYFDASQLDDAGKQVSELSYQQLTVLRKALNPSKMSAKLAGVRASVAGYKGSIQGQSTQSQSTRQKVKRAGITPADTVAAPDDDFPARNPFCKDTNGVQYTQRIPVAVILAADVTYFVAETVQELAQDACNEVLVVAGEGGNARAACIATDTVWVIAHALWEAIHFCNEEFTDATVDAMYDRLDDIHTDLLESITNDNTNAANIITNDNNNTASLITNNNNNTASIITNDNNNTTSIINNDNANKAMIISELRTVACEVIRLLNTPMGQRSSNIQSCVGQPGFPYDFNHNGKASAAPAPAMVVTGVSKPGSAPVSRGQDGVPILPLVGTVTMEIHLLEGRLIPTYYLPAAKGGMIEQVQLLVWNTINSQAELDIAKDRTEQARQLALQADQLLNQKKYVEAYRQYSLAYQTLVPAS